MPKAKQVTGEEVIDTMRMVVQWYTMYSYCNSKKGCIDCPYNRTQPCGKKSTIEIMSISARTFQKFLKQKEHPVE